MERLEPYMTEEERDEVLHAMRADEIHATVTLIEAGTRRAVQKALAHYRRQAVWAFVILGIGLVIAFAVQRYDNAATNDAIVSSGSVVAVEGCNRDFTRDMRWRRTFIRFRIGNRISYKAGRTPFTRYVMMQKFWDKEIRELDKTLPDCRDAATSITVNTTRHLTVPRPLYPGSPEAKRLARLDR